MLSSSVCSYTDAEAYAKALPNAEIDLGITQPGDFRAHMTLITLHDLQVRRFTDNLARVTYGALAPGRAIISFRLEPGPDLYWDGLEMLPTTILQHNDGSCCFQRSAGNASWGSISLPGEQIGTILSTLIGRDPALSREPATLVPCPTAMVTLQRLHAASCALAQRAPEILANPDAARGMTQALIEAMGDCVHSAGMPDETAHRSLHASVMRRFRQFVEANTDRALYIAEISEATGVSGRTLRNCCREHLGMGASQYLILRRMHLARRALYHNPDVTTVTEAATCYGFWELGRFSVSYRALFGEMPSRTLRRGRQALHMAEAAMSTPPSLSLLSPA